MASPPRPSRDRTSAGEARVIASPTKRKSTASRTAGATPVAAPTGAIDVILLGAQTELVTAFAPVLHELERRGEVRVAAIIPGGASAPEGALSAQFPLARVVRSLDEATSPPDSLVVLATPPRQHTVQAAAAFKRGWHVLTDAQLAATAHESAALIEVATRHERMLVPDMHWRRFPTTQYIRTLCQDHLLGPLFGFSIHDWAPPVDVTAATGGILTRLGIRALDLLGWWLGSSRLLRYADDAMGGAETNALIELAFNDGLRGKIHLSCDWPVTSTYELLFERAILRWSPPLTDRLTLQLASAPAAAEATLVPALRPGATTTVEPLASLADCRRDQLRNVLAAIRRAAPLTNSAPDITAALWLVDECYGRRTLLEAPWLTRNELARARTLSAPTLLRRP
jgi:predicted dehydrogenase